MNVPLRNLGWTDALVAEAQRLKAEGHTMQAVADRLGRTRNAVIGKLNRPDSFHRPKGWMALPTSPRALVRALKSPTPALAPRRHIPEAIRNPTTLMDLKPDQCRYPLWGVTPVPMKLYCGAPVVPDEPYCSACRAVVYLPRKASA